MIPFLFIIHICFALSEKTLWEKAFDNFLLENENQTVLYSTLTYSGKDRSIPFKIIFIYLLSEPKGIVIFTDGKMITNYFDIFYSKETNKLLYGDIQGGLWEHQETEEILKLISKTNLQMIICKDIRLIALPNNGILQW
jgi:hypothetical protein